MRPISRKDQLLTGKEAVAEAVKSRLQLLLGTWWENASLGFAVPSFLWDGVRTPQGPTMLTNYITAYIAETEGVLEVKDASGVFNGHALNYQCTIVTEDGETEWRMNQNALLLSLS